MALLSISKWTKGIIDCPVKTAISVQKKITEAVTSFFESQIAAYGFHGLLLSCGLMQISEATSPLSTFTGLSLFGISLFNARKLWLREKCERFGDVFPPQSTDEKGKELMLVIWPKYDHNGCFSLASFSEIKKGLKGRYQIEFCLASSISDIQRKCRELGKKVIHHILIGGHGSKNLIQLGSCRCCDRIHRCVIRPSLFPNLSPKGHILLKCCSTGKSEGIAERFSEAFPQATIFAPSADSCPCCSHIYIDSQNKPCLLQFNCQKEPEETDRLLTRVLINKQESFSHLWNDFRSIQSQLKLDSRKTKVLFAEYAKRMSSL